MLEDRKTYLGGASGQSSIGPEGGTLEVASVRLTVPAGALTSRQLIKMRLEIADRETFTGFSAAAPRIILEPEGLRFAQPVTLQIPYGSLYPLSAVEEALVSLYYDNPTIGEVELLETTKDPLARVVSARLEHFSTYSALYLSIDDVVSGLVTNPVQIKAVAVGLRNYLQAMPGSNSGRRNYFYSFFEPTFLPFMNIARAVYAPASDPISLAFPGDDFDSDGNPNIVDSFPLDPTNGGDTSGPTIVSVTPSGTGVSAAPGDIVVRFSEPVATPTLRGAVRLTSGGVVYALDLLSVDATRTIATYHHAYSLWGDTLYTVEVAGVTDLTYNKMATNTSNTFHTADLTGPVLVAMSPSGNNVPVTTSTVTLAFSEAMQPGTLAGQLIGPGNPGLVFQSLSPDGRTATFSLTEPLIDSFVYSLNLSANARDLAGNPVTLGPATFSFRTEDLTPPSIAYVLPDTLTVNPDTPEDIRIRFNEPMNPASLAGKVTLSGGTLNPTVTLRSLDIYGLVATFSIDGPLDQEQEYLITVSSGYADVAGNASTLAKAMGYFKTLDTIRPQVASFLPHGGNVAYTSGVTLAITFTEGILPGTLPTSLAITRTVNGAAVPNTLVGYDPVAFVATYGIASGDLQTYERYDVSLAAVVTDDYHNVITGPLTSWFRTQSFDDPHIVNYSLDKCGGVKTSLRLFYDRTMDPASVTGHAMYLRHFYTVYETRDVAPSLMCATYHPAQENPNLGICLLACAIFNPTYECAAACYILNPPIPAWYEYAPTCLITDHYAASEVLTLPFKTSISSDQTFVFEAPQILASSSSYNNLYIQSDPAGGTSTTLPAADLDGRPANQPYFTQSPPVFGNTCP
ncbi:MAG TPA: Ig-like domain-containing protein [Kofleriaceae bacterium]|nr:Ig-like domain-containing protein [Kofleriaceae bacterium]